MVTAGEARYRLIEAKSLTRVPGSTDPWFLGRYGMNLYRGCEHACAYCDGRAERYHVSGDFAREIVVKNNAPEVLARELQRIREPGFVLLGGGVCDAYQPAEARFGLARAVLEIVVARGLPAHVLTKSALVERDLDLLAQIAAGSRAILSFSIQTVDEQLRRRFEPGAAPLAARWRLLAEARRRGIATGVMAMPVLPGLSDQPEAIDALVARAADAGAEFVCYGGLTLRPGVQKQTYLELIARYHTEHMPGYERVYRSGRASGAGDSRYYARVDQRFRAALDRHGLPARPPRHLFSGVIPRYAEIAVLLEHEAHALMARADQRRLASALMRSGQALQRWARARFARQRRRDFDHQAVERELQQMLAEDSLTNLDGMAAEALPMIAKLLRNCSLT